MMDDVENKIQVLHLLNGEFFSGVEQVVMTLVHYHQRVRPSIVNLMKGEMVRRVTGERVLDIFPMKSRVDLRVVRRLTKYVQDNRIDLIHAHTLRANLVGSFVGWKRGLPVVVTIHSSSSRESTNRIKNFRNSCIERLLIPLTTAYICVSDSLRKEMIRKGVPPSRVFVIRNGIDAERYRNGDGSAFRTSLGLGPRSPLIGTIALLRPRKGIEFLLRAVPGVIKVIPEARFVIVGDAADAHYVRSLHKLCQDLGITHKIQFIGFLNDIPNVLSALDVFVLPSLFGEGLPMAILEAMAAGNPVIATRVEGNEEVLVDGETGILVPPRNEEAIVKALIDLLSNPDKRSFMGRRSQQRAFTQFHGARMTDQTERLYQDMLLRGKHV